MHNGPSPENAINGLESHKLCQFFFYQECTRITVLKFVGLCTLKHSLWVPILYVYYGICNHIHR